AGVSLLPERTWNGATRVHDVKDSTLLTSSEKSVTLWSLTSATPTSTETITFRSNVIAALFGNPSVIALLDDGTVWSGTQQVPVPKTAFIAREDNAYAFVETRDDGKTVIRHYTTA